MTGSEKTFYIPWAHRLIDGIYNPAHAYELMYASLMAGTTYDIRRVLRTS